MLTAAGISTAFLPWIGLLELGIAVTALLLWRWRAWFVWNALAMVVALGAVAWQSRSYLWAAFNPVTLNLAVIALSLIGYVSSSDLPSAAHCVRLRPKETA